MLESRATQIRAREEQARHNTFTKIAAEFGPNVGEAATNFVHGTQNQVQHTEIQDPVHAVAEAIVSEVGGELSTQVQEALGRGLEAVLIIMNHRVSKLMSDQGRSSNAGWI